MEEVEAARVHRPIRLALVIGQLSIGGAEGQLKELVRRLDRARFEPLVYVLSEGTGPIRESIEADGCPVRVIGRGGVARVRRLAAALAMDRVAMVHSWLFIANSYAWLARALGRRVPLITSARNCKSQGRVHDWLNRAAFRSSARIVANSTEVANYVTAHFGVCPDGVTVVHNGVDIERFRPVDDRCIGAPTIITAGRFVAQKNPLLFLEAARLLTQSVPDARFLMAGDGPLRAAAEARAAQLGLRERVRFLGERYDMPELFSRAHMLWLTSSWEGLPNVVLEAMASGLPVIASDVGGTRELIHSGIEGFLVRPGAAADIAGHAVTILRDATLHASMRTAARSRAEQFSMTRMSRAMEAVYGSCAG